MKTQTIITNEWRNLLRGKVAKLLFLLLLLLSIFALWQSHHLFVEQHDARKKAQQHMRERFLSQGEVNPHAAAHYGHFVYKPVNTLSIFDQGVNPFTGLSLRLEGHKQNEAMFAPSQQSTSLLRFGQLDLCLILQVLVPLLIIFVCHDTISGLKEQGTLSLLLVQGATIRRLIWAKVLAYWLIWMAYLLLSLAVLLLFSAASVDQDTLLRMILLLAAYGLYFGIVTAVTVYVSALSRSSRYALLPLLFGWLCCAVLLPKAMANISEQRYPLTARLVLDERIKTDNRNGINGHDPRNERTKKFKDSLLKSFGVDSVSQLPVNLDGLTMQADEEYHNKVYDRHLGGIEAQIAKQNRLVAWSAVVNPFAAVQQLSMGIAGTDTYHHFDFTRRAEDYRRHMIRKLNLEQAYGGSRTGDWDWKVKADYWKKFGDMAYAPPTIDRAIRNNLIECCALLFWSAALLILIHFTANRIKLI